jgi:hypothetical protein
MEYTSLENIIKQHVYLPSQRKNGWHPVLCKICNDHGKKGKRAAFKFENNTIGYNCFNCGHTALYDPSVHQIIPKNMVQVLTAFGIEEHEWKQCLLENLKKHPEFSKQKQKEIDYNPTEIQLPEFFVELKNDTNEWSQYAIEYLKNQRGINYKDYPFYICNNITNNPLSKKWYGRLIIPIYKDNKIIFYQGRDLSNKRKTKYLSPNVERSKVLYGFDHLLTNEHLPLYICEGFFDAFLLNGVAVFGRKISKEQIFWINKSPRKKVVVPDRFGDNSDQFAEQALKLGWGVSTPDIGDAKDVSEAFMKYGKIYTLQSIKENTHEGLLAQIKTKFYCE